MINGIINVYKEAGYTSFDVVARLRGITHQKKIGHTGTLDPDATGVLPVCLGNATKLVDLMTDKQKEYVATLRLGIATDTQDISGKVIETCEVDCSEEQVYEVISSFAGEQDQIPPMYSALKVDGKKLYELAREGRTVERKPRRITVYEIEVLKMALPDISIRVLCSKGTYIRTICDDIGRKLGCGATMTSLKRTSSGIFGIDDAYKLDEIESMAKDGSLDKVVLTTDSVFMDCASASLEGEPLRLALNGNPLDIKIVDKYIDKNGDRNRIRLYDDKGEFFALYVKKGPRYAVDKMFL